MYARQKVPMVQVWQYEDGNMLPMPMWISGCTEMHGDGLYLVRRSGKQRIEPSDWLVQEADGDPLWLTDAEFQREYELLYGRPHDAA